MNIEGIITITCGVITTIAMVLLAIITLYYARQTRRLVQEQKLARRDDPDLFVSINDPDDHEWEKDISRINKLKLPKSSYLRVKALLVNPGVTPIVINSFSEKFSLKGEIISIQGKFLEPKLSSSDRYGLYMFASPWVIIHDDFAIFYRVYEIVTAKENSLYKLTIDFNYRVGDTIKSEKKEMEVKPHVIK